MFANYPHIQKDLVLLNQLVGFVYLSVQTCALWCANIGLAFFIFVLFFFCVTTCLSVSFTYGCFCSAGLSKGLFVSGPRAVI